jgi:tetratricopeptide (TPR) repeat protein
MRRVSFKFCSSPFANRLFGLATRGPLLPERNPVAGKAWVRCRRSKFSGFGWALSAILVLAGSASAEPFLPRDGAQVLERLRAAPLDPATRETRQLRAQLSENPTNLAVASQFARMCIERSRTEADPRYLGRAQAALAPWWNATNPPADALVLRGTIRQNQHDFTNALADLDLALQKSPRHAQAWLTRATVLTVLGDFPAARRACVPLAQLAPGLLALTAATTISCLSGDAEHGSALLRNALDAYPQTSAVERIWALTVLGEASARLGHQAQAEGYFKRGLELDRRDPYLQGAYADFLLDQGRSQDCAALLQDALRADGLLLRLTLAESQLTPRPPSLEAHLNTLLARFDAGHRRGDFVHQREEACLVLHLLGRPRQALQLAQDNWRVQHEPADARILLESALASGDRSAAQPVLDFMQTSRIEDVRLAALAKALHQ